MTREAGGFVFRDHGAATLAALDSEVTRLAHLTVV
jgi:hypothetical protein